MVHEHHEHIFRAGSRTYYYSSRFFPKPVRDDVTILYGFVRVADNFVDTIPQQPEGFKRFCGMYRKASSTGKPSEDRIIDSFIELEKRRSFNPAWTEAFLTSMEMDLTKQVYESLDETLKYIYGSAEVIGLFMARIMELPEAADFAASRLGRAMQYINFIRDIDEDLSLGRQYLPSADAGLPDLRRESAEAEREAFIAYIRTEIDRYEVWQQEAAQGYQFIPRRYLIPIQTAAEMYGWTAGTIRRDPFIVYQRKVKPTKARIIMTGLRHLIGG